MVQRFHVFPRGIRRRNGARPCPKERFRCSAGQCTKLHWIRAATENFLRGAQGERTFEGRGAALANGRTSKRADRSVFGEGHSSAPSCAVRGLCREGKTAKLH